jgi:tRNA(Ile)-lysidine synthase
LSVGARDVREILTTFPDALLAAPRWWVALSGGSDSVALLYALAAYRDASSAPPLRAIHVNHGLHAAAGEWSDLCQRHADRLSIPLHINVCNIEPSGRGLEADARRERYRAFEGVLAEGDILFTAHHADDMVETVLLRLLRGAGPRGLSGIPRERACGAGRIFRPLLNTTSDTLRSAVEAAGLEYVIDPSNLETEQDRNYLRQVVLPVVAERWPGYRETIQRAAGLQRMAQQRLSQLPLPRTETTMGEPALVIDPTVDVAELAAQIHQWLGESDIDSPNQRRLLELARQALEAGLDRQPELRWGDGCLRVWNGWVVSVTEPASDWVLPGDVVIGEPAEGNWGRLDWEPADDGPGLPTGAQLACGASGEVESVTPLNRPQKPTNKWLQEMRIPPWWRRYLPVLWSETAPVWVLPVGPLSAAADMDNDTAEPGLRPVWHLSLSL